MNDKQSLYYIMKELKKRDLLIGLQKGKKDAKKNT